MRMSLPRSTYVVFMLLLAAVAVQPAWATLPTPSQPILLVQDSTSTDPYQNYIPELLTTEGLNGFQTAQLGDLTLTFLTPANYDVVILPHLTLTSAEATIFQNYVNAGGTLVGFRPDLQLAAVFGVSSLGTTLPEAWLKIDTTMPYAPAQVTNVLRFHGTADLYSVNSATAIATLYNSPTVSTTSPAAAVNTYGLGKAILFSFDLTQSIVLMRQGNPAWAGYPDNHDGYNTMRASGMFMDKASGKFWNDLGDDALNDVPQADIELRLFSNAVTLTNAPKRPLPRLWYYPNQDRSLLLITGDHHGDVVSNSISEINTIQSYGGLFSEFLWYPYGSISNAQVNTWLAAGNTMGIHFDDTAEVDSSGVGGSNATWNGMQSVISNAKASFATTFPTAPFPVTTRDHFLIWVSNDANGTADQVAQAKLFQNNGIKFDTSYSSFPNRWGYMTGSGMPMKFLDTAAGTVIPVYEQATQYEDDVQVNTTNAYSMQWSFATAQGHYQQSLSDSLNKYNTVVTMLFHPDAWSSYSTYATTVLQYAQAQSIPMYTTGAWLSFWQARAATTLSEPTFISNVLSFTATGSPAGLSLLVPQASGTNKVVSTIQVDGASQSFTVGTYQGVVDAGVVLAAGNHNISVTYVPAGRILGQVSPSGAASSTTIQVQGGSINETVPVAGDGTYVVGPLPAGTYIVTPLSSSYAFTPTSQTVPLGSADVTGVNFTVSSAVTGETIFTTQTPVTTNASDGAGVNYELGTAFTSGIAGQITGVRFWKASSETGTHTGKIWSSTGVLLASVAFAGETASGWQQQPLTTPLSIAANTPYVVSVNTGNTYYVSTSSGLSSQVNNGDLHSVVGNNGVYGASGSFPTSSYQNSNYFRDIVFTPGITYSASGSITPAASGSGATLTLTLGGSTLGTVTANASGSYTFSGLPNGSYTVTPSKTGYTFNPTSAPAVVNNGNVTVANFAATSVPTYTASGSITPGATASGATVTLSLGGITVTTTTADASGNYSFTGLSNGSYTVTPTKTGYSFNPTSAPATINNANVTVAAFTITAVPTYSISGSITPAASGTGTTVTLTLGASTIATATADVSGNYSFTGVVAGSYTVTPTKTGFTFSPISAPATVSNANVTVATFTATANSATQTLFTTQTPATTNNSDGSSVNYELGTSFTADTAGQITAVRFWKASSETGTHTGRIWSSTGTLLASVVFTNETASGWQQQALTTALNITASTTYVVSVNTGATYYVATNSGLATQINSGNLHSVVGANGLYGATGTFPTSSYQASNYFRDIVFAPSSTVGPPASVTATAGSGQSAVTGAVFATALQATVKDASSNPVSNVTVTFTAPATGATGTFPGSVTTVTATTNASGVATAPAFTANTTLGAYSVAASVTGVTPSAAFSLTNTVGSPASVAATAGAGQSAAISTAFTTALQATVKDASGNLLPNVTVTFTAPASGASGTFPGAVTTVTATTNASGVAAAPAFTANTTLGAYSVTASVTGVSPSASFSLTNTAGPAASIAATTGTPQSAAIGTAFATALTATVKDAGGNLLANVTVTFTAPSSGAGGTFTGGLTTVTASTNASGVATAPTFTANTTTGAFAVTAGVTGVSPSASFSLTNTSTPSSIAVSAGSGQSATIGAAFATQLQAIVKDAGSNPVNGVVVTFAAPGTGASGTFAGGTTTATTNASGIATAVVFTANSTAGAYTVTAGVAGVATPASFSLTNNPGAAASITATAGTGQSAKISSAFTTQLQATVKDSGGNLLNNVTVTFTAPATGASGTFAGGVTTATTASGVATAAVFTANATAGAYTVTASVAGVATPASFSLTNTAGAAASIAATAGSGQSAPVSTAFATALQATVKDAGSNPVSGVTVTFTAPTTGASGSFTGSVTTVTAATNASGVATAPAFTANATTGAYAVTASVAGVATPASFSLTNTAAAGIAVDVTTSTDRSTKATTIVSPSFSTAATNELLLAFISTDAASSGTNTSVSSIAGGSLTWTLVTRTNTQLGTSEIWRAFASAKLSAVTVTATLSQSEGASITVMSYTGVNTTGTNGSGAIGAIGSGNANPGAPTASLLTTKANSWVVGVGNDWDNAISRTAGANQTVVHQYVSTTGDTYWVQRVTTLSPAGTTVTVNDTAPATDRYNLAICEIVGP